MGFDGVRDSLESNRESPVAEFLEHSVATRSGVRFNTGCLHEFSHSSSRVETLLFVVIPILHRMCEWLSQGRLMVFVGDSTESSISSQGSLLRWPAASES